MYYEHKKIRANSDDTWNYDVIGEFPITFREFIRRILSHTNSFRVQFVATNECFGGWLNNMIEVYKTNGADSWHIVKQEPPNWINQVAHLNITKCWANGGWGQITYFCTFDAEDSNEL